jgi:hypothetical protein
MTDFGGRIELTGRENVLSEALRELREETHGLFSFEDEETENYILSNNHIYIHEQCGLIFQEIWVDSPNDLCSEFIERNRKYSRAGAGVLENSHMVWISHTNLKYVLQGESVPIPKTLRGAIECTFEYYPPMFEMPAATIAKSYLPNVPYKR